MTPENFVYWLQGYFEINDAAGPGISSAAPGTLKYLNEKQIRIIQDHLNSVLEKKTAVRLPYSFSPPTMTTGIDPVYYPHNSPSPPASC